MIQLEVSTEELLPLKGMILYRDLENLLVVNKEDIHDTMGYIDEGKVMDLAISKYKCFPYRLNEIGSHSGSIVFIRE